MTFKIVFFYLAVFILLISPLQQNKIDQSFNKELKQSSDSISSNNSEYKFYSIQDKAFHIINSAGIDIRREENRILNLEVQPGKNYLLSLLNKRERKYTNMYNLLIQVLPGFPPFYNYYNELVFAASAVDKLDKLKKELDSKRKETPYIYYAKSIIYSSLNEYENALKYIDLALQSNNGNYDVLFQKALILRNSGNYDAALELANKIFRNFSDNPVLNAQTLNLKGTLYNFSNLYDEALIYYRKSESCALQSGSNKLLSSVFTNIGIIFDESGKIDSARYYYNKAIDKAKEISDMESEAFAFSELGVSYSYTNDLPLAKKYYQESYKLYSALGNKLRLSFLLNNLGRVYVGYSNFRAAIESFESGIQLAGENKRALIQNLIGAADVYADLSNYSSALSYYTRAGKLAEQIKEISLQTEVNIGLGSLNYNLNQLQNAREYFNRAEKGISQTGNQILTVDILNKTGVVLMASGDLQNAQEYFSKAILKSEEIMDVYTQVSASLNLSALYLQTKEYSKAEQLAASCKRIIDEYDLKEMSGEQEFILGKLFKEKKQLPAALKYFDNSFLSGKNLQNYNLQIESCFEIAKIFETKGDIQKARDFYNKAVDLIDEVSRYLSGNNEIQISYFTEKNEIFKSFTEFYIKQNKFREAFNIVDRSRSRNVVNYLNNIVIQSLIKDKNSLDKLIEQDWLIHSELFSGNTDSLMKSNDSLKINLIKSEPRLYQYLIYQKHPDIISLQEVLSDDEYLFTFYVSQDYSLIFRVGRNSFNYYKIAAGKDELITKLHAISSYFNSGGSKEAYINPDLFSFDSEAAYNLYKKFLFPALENIPDGSKLIISPPAELMVLPFELLVTQINTEQGRFDYLSQKYLLYKYDISYIPSSAAWINLKQKKNNSAGEVLLIGNPQVNQSIASLQRGLSERGKNIPGISFSALKYSGDEIDRIKKVLPADIVLTSGDATESAFKANAPKSRIIHLSTHSFLLNNQPFIFFSPEKSNSDDGFLEEGEIVQLKLNADIVVLSSCSSGLGTIDEAEGIIGLTKAFYEAGAKAVVYSLWDVNDRYTSRLMALFYQYLSKGFDKSEALKRAKSDFIIQYSPNPYYWAAFVLSGNTSPLQFKPIFIYSNYILLAAAISITVLFFVSYKKIKKRVNK